jgi:hypothetical protein
MEKAESGLRLLTKVPDKALVLVRALCFWGHAEEARGAATGNGVGDHGCIEPVSRGLPIALSARGFPKIFVPLAP